MSTRQHIQSNKTPRTDIGTVVLHWIAVLALAIAAVTGLAIAADSTDRPWLRAARMMLPQGDIWSLHILAGLTLAALAVSYAVYLRQAGLRRRVRLDRVRLYCLFRRGAARWRALNVVLTWLLYTAMAAQMVTGVALYLGLGGTIVTLHFWIAIALLGYPIVHTLAHYAGGGLPQLLRILRPTRLANARPEATFADLVAEHFDRSKSAEPHKRPPTTLHAHPLAVAAATGIAVAAMATSLDVASRDRLIVRAIERTEAPRLDGDLADPVWRKAPLTIVHTQQGANFGGTGASSVRIRAVHDGEWAYFAFTWDDPTRSLKHLPLIKKADGWHLVHTHYDIEDENAYYEDKFAVMLAASASLPAAGAAHSGNQPLPGKPAAFSGRGLHYTTDGSIVDVWHWKAARGGLLGWMDDNYFGPPIEPTNPEISGKSRYKAGYATDPGKAIYANNFDQKPPGGYAGTIVPKRLPKDLLALHTAMGPVDLDPDHGEAEGAQWWMTDASSVPYALDVDARIPIGTVIPGVIISGTTSGDRADIRCAARWAAGRWTLEVARKLDTRSAMDVAIKTGISMWVSAFDHAQTRHTRHMRPIRLEVE